MNWSDRYQGSGVKELEKIVNMTSFAGSGPSGTSRHSILGKGFKFQFKDLWSPWQWKSRTRKTKTGSKQESQPRGQSGAAPY